MIKASSGSGLTNEEKAVTHTHSGYYIQYPIDRIHHIFYDKWKPIPARPIHQWHLFLMSRDFKEDLHVLWAYKLGWHIHFLKVPSTSLICKISPFSWLPDLSISFNSPYPYFNILYLTYPLLTPPTSPLQPSLPHQITLASSPQQPINTSSPTHQLDSHLDPVHPTTPIPSPPTYPPTAQAIPTSITSPLPFYPASAITCLQTSVQSLIDAQTVTHQRLEQHFFLIQQQHETIT